MMKSLIFGAAAVALAGMFAGAAGPALATPATSVVTHLPVDELAKSCPRGYRPCAPGCCPTS